jgi:TonB family protein
MKILFLAIASIAGIVSMAQDTVYTYLDAYGKPASADKVATYTIQHRDKGRWKKLSFTHDDKIQWVAYYSDSACTQYDGPYISYYDAQRKKTSGLYSANKKTGDWKTLSDNGKLIDSAFYKDGFISGVSLRWNTDGTVADSMIFEEKGKGVSRGYWTGGTLSHVGTLDNGKRNGSWTYYHKNGNKSQEVMYAADSAISYTCYDEKGNVQTDKCYYEKEAHFKGGDDAWRKYLSRRLSSARLPNDYYSGKISGVVIAQFIVDMDGSIKDIKVVKSVRSDLDDVVVDIIRSGPKWEPAVQYNRKVKAYRKQPVTFAKVQ